MRSLPILFLLCVCLAPQPLPAQTETPENQPAAGAAEDAGGPPAEAVPGGAENEVDGAESSAQQDVERKRRKQKIEIGLILTSVIVIVGVFLVVLTLLYGRRTKRQLASGRGPSAPRDDLWYLKKSREASSTKPSDAEQEEGTE